MVISLDYFLFGLNRDVNFLFIVLDVEETLITDKEPCDETGSFQFSCEEENQSMTTPLTTNNEIQYQPDAETTTGSTPISKHLNYF